jgi:cytochrome c
MSGQAQTKLPNIEKVEQALEHAKEFLKCLDAVLEGLEVNFADGALLEAYSSLQTNIYDRGMHAYVLLEIANFMVQNMPNHVAEYLENVKGLVEEAVEDLEALLRTIEQEGGGGE